MRLHDLLSSFSMDDLRILAARRGLDVPEKTLQNRQELLRYLAASLELNRNIAATLVSLGRAELELLEWILWNRWPGLTRFAQTLGVAPATVRGVLENLRLSGLVFPMVDWERIEMPVEGGMLRYLLRVTGFRAGSVPSLEAPPLEPARRPADLVRPGSVDRDLAEFLARVARSRFRLTRTGCLNRRDLRAMEPAFPVRTSGYANFLAALAASLGLVDPAGDLLTVTPDADAWLGRPPERRAAECAVAWIEMAGYPETERDPEEASQLPPSLELQRAQAVRQLASLPSAGAVTVASFTSRLVWGAPLAFGGASAALPGEIGARLVRSLFWLGLVAVDDPHRPSVLRLSARGAGLLGRAAEAPSPVPEDPCFLVQPNAEVFAPPNLAPRTFFHLRRLTGEKPGGPEGMFALTAESLRRALDTGLTVADVLTFLERFSRTGLPANLRDLVETIGRRHGRLRLVPAEYVLVADDPHLLEEVRRSKTIAPLLGEPLTERSVCVPAAWAPALLRQLRQRGYAPAWREEQEGCLPLPLDLENPPSRDGKPRSPDGVPGAGRPGGRRRTGKETAHE